MIYEPREDSFLLQKQIKKYCKPNYVVLDMGTGSGIQAREAALYCKSVVGVDVQKSVIDNFNKNKKYFDDKRLKKITYKVSDLFSNVKGKYDLIIFNPPYLPENPKDKDVTLDGGKKGYELVERFLSEVSAHLKKDGKVLLLFSSLTKKNKVEEFITKNGLKFREVAKQKIFFEELYVYVLEKNDLVKVLEKKKMKNIKVFAHGKRGLLYVADLGGTKIAVKTKYSKSDAQGTIKGEVLFLKRLNKYKLGPKLLFFNDMFFAYKFVSGKFIKEFIETEKSKAKIKTVLRNVFNQCFVMDKLGINKEEMHNPYKHIIIGESVVMIDFERANFSPKPHNVTQFVQYVMRNKRFLDKVGFKVGKKRLIELSKKYKNNICKKNFDKVLNAVN